MATHSSILALGNPMDRGTWHTAVHGVAKSQTQLSAHITHTHTHTEAFSWRLSVEHTHRFLPPSVTSGPREEERQDPPGDLSFPVTSRMRAC